MALCTFASKRLNGMERWQDEGYLMYFFHPILLFIPVLWREKRRGGRRESGETSEQKREPFGWRGGERRAVRESDERDRPWWYMTTTQMRRGEVEASYRRWRNETKTRDFFWHKNMRGNHMEMDGWIGLCLLSSTWKLSNATWWDSSQPSSSLVPSLAP